MSVIRSILFSMALLLSALACAGPVNINTADAETIAGAMSGVGLKKAQAIVEYRNKNGSFKSLDELSQVKGIGSKTIVKNRANLSLDAGSEAK